MTEVAAPISMINTAKPVHSRSNTGYYVLGVGATLMIAAAAGVMVLQNKKKQDELLSEKLLSSYVDDECH